MVQLLGASQSEKDKNRVKELIYEIEDLKDVNLDPIFEDPSDDLDRLINEYGYAGAYFAYHMDGKMPDALRKATEKIIEILHSEELKSATRVIKLFSPELADEIASFDEDNSQDISIFKNDLTNLNVAISASINSQRSEINRLQHSINLIQNPPHELSPEAWDGLQDDLMTTDHYGMGYSEQDLRKAIDRAKEYIKRFEEDLRKLLVLQKRIDTKDALFQSEEEKKWLYGIAKDYAYIEDDEDVLRSAIVICLILSDSLGDHEFIKELMARIDVFEQLTLSQTIIVSLAVAAPFLKSDSLKESISDSLINILEADIDDSIGSGYDGLSDFAPYLIEGISELTVTLEDLDSIEEIFERLSKALKTVKKDLPESTEPLEEAHTKIKVHVFKDRKIIEKQKAKTIKRIVKCESEERGKQK